MKDFELTIEQTTGRAAMSFAASDSLFNNVYLSLVVKKGSWWLLPNFGSRIHTLRKNTAGTLAADYIQEALAWLKTSGRARDIVVKTERVSTAHGMTRLNALITVQRPNSEPVKFSLFFPLV
ncbi:MAG: hypothetical protein GX410_01545 [Elusimicrobia bacterium]|nr:hypothetical protein [Elusimicrobiota bacterium]